MTETITTSDLKNSSLRVGRLYPVLVDRDGNVIDGKHRLAVDADWPRLTLDHIGSEKDRVLARLASNVCRRAVSSDEKSEMLETPGTIFLEEGEKQANLGYRIAAETGMSYRWVMKYLPTHLKDRPGLGGPSKLPKLENGERNKDTNESKQCPTMDILKILSGSSERVVLVRTYVNTDFVHLILEKRCYENLQKAVESLGVTPETVISNMIDLLLNEIKNIPARAD